MMTLSFSIPLFVRQKWPALFSLLAWLCVALPLEAQDQAAQIDTQQNLVNRPGLGELQPGAPYQITSPDLGEIDLVSRTPRPKMFTFSTSQSFNYTSNAFLTDTDARDAFFWNGRFDASLVPYATRDITPRLTFEQNFFRYTRFSRLDFDSQTLQLDVKWDLNRSDTWFVNTSYAINRLYSPRGSAGEFYRYGLANVSLTNYRPFGPFNLLATAGVYSRHGESSAFDRVAPYFNAVLVTSPIQNVQISAFVRPELQFYTNDPARSDRRDFNLNVGTAVAWTPIEYFSLGATLAFVGNFSNADMRDYNAFTPAIAVGGQISF